LTALVSTVLKEGIKPDAFLRSQGPAEYLLAETAKALELQPVGLRANCIICSLFFGRTPIYKNRQNRRDLAPGPGLGALGVASPAHAVAPRAVALAEQPEPQRTML
jgi:hypothetical protein